MISTIIIDLDEQYLEGKKEYLNTLQKEHFLDVKYANENDVASLESVVVTDNVRAGEIWNGYAVIGIEHSEQIKYISYVTDDVLNVDFEYLEMVYARKHKIPLVIAETERLIIREMMLKDVVEICRLYEDTDNARFLPPVSDVCEEEKKVAAYIENMYALYGYGMWVLVCKENHKIIGRVGIEHREIEGVVFRELGYFVERTYQHRGYAYEASKEILKWAKINYIEELIIYVDEKNTPSVKLAEKLGFSFTKSVTDGDKIYCIYNRKFY